MDRILRVLEPPLYALYTRYSDEKVHEDFSEYEKVMQRIAEEAGVKFVSVSKRPFGMVIQPEAFPYQVAIHTTKKQIRWSAVIPKVTKTI